MSDPTLTELKNYISSILSDQITRMQESAGGTMSRLFHDKRVEDAEKFTRLDSKMDVMISHVKETNGRVKKNETSIEDLEEVLRAACTTEDIVEIREEMKALFWRIMKIVGIIFLIGSFVWIKESRDFIITLLFKIF